MSKPKQRNPKKKWMDLKPKQRERALAVAAERYRNERNRLGRALGKSEKENLIKTMKLDMWIPLEARKPKFMNEFSRQENLIQRDIERNAGDSDE